MNNMSIKDSFKEAIKYHKGIREIKRRAKALDKIEKISNKNNLELFKGPKTGEITIKIF